MNRLLLAGVLGTAVLLGPGMRAQEDESPITLLRAGIFAIQKKDYPAAQKAFEKVVAGDADNFTALYYLAVCEAKQAHYPKSVDYLRRAIESGFPRWQSLKKDQFFDDARKNRVFRDESAKVFSRFDKRERGLIQGLEYSFARPDAEGNEVTSKQFEGKVLAILFLDTEGTQGLEAAIHLMQLVEERSLPLAAVGLARVVGKDEPEQHRLLREFQELYQIRFPLLVGTEKERAALKPFRKAPTVLFLDAKGVPRSIVEGLPTKDAPGAYKKAAEIARAAGERAAKADGKPPK